ncbi:MAG: 16S rRNA (adenine(1518)-N(6)/adenine(1519)-N(6)) -dimethyltransferase RsmA [Alphaproteobacteria bacterium]
MSRDAIAAMPPLREVIAEHRLSAEKSLGQNFLLDLNLTARIARSAGDLSGVHVVEIGPGPGGLTRALLMSDAETVTAIERDRRIADVLAPMSDAAEGRFRFVEGDAMEVDAASLVPAPRAIIANLPYNIATPLLIGWLEQASHWQSLTLMFQKEVALRIVATPGSKAYGRLAVLTALTAQAQIALTLPPQAFTPPPKVESAVVHLVPHADQPAPDLLQAVSKVTAAAFGQRRKMLRKSLSPLFVDTEASLISLDIPPTARAETIPPDGFRALATLWLEQRGAR